MASMKTIRWGMIGCGAVAEVKSGPGFYKAGNSALIAVTSNDAGQAQSYAARHGVATVYNSNEALVADPAIDAVYIATPPVLPQTLVAVGGQGRQACLRRKADGHAF